MRSNSLGWIFLKQLKKPNSKKDSLSSTNRVLQTLKPRSDEKYFFQHYFQERKDIVSKLFFLNMTIPKFLQIQELLQRFETIARLCSVCCERVSSWHRDVMFNNSQTLCYVWRLTAIHLPKTYNTVFYHFFSRFVQILFHSFLSIWTFGRVWCCVSNRPTRKSLSKSKPFYFLTTYHTVHRSCIFCCTAKNLKHQVERN
jgi:hypothetical protein